MRAVAPPVANVITLGARDLPARRGIYQRLGWPLVLDADDFGAFELRGAVLALFPVEKLAADGHAQPETSSGGIRFTLDIIADQAAGVDAPARRVRDAGGRIAKNAVDAEHFEGRSAYFAGPEDNYWEIAWGPPNNPIVAAARRAAGSDR